MATFEKRGQYWRVKIRRAGLPPQTRTFDNKTQAQQWARNVESEIDKGIVVDRRVAERLSLAELLERYRREVTPNKRGAAGEQTAAEALRGESQLVDGLRSGRTGGREEAALPDDR